MSDWQLGAVYDAPQYTFVMAVFSYTPVYTVERDVEHPSPGVRRDTPIANLQEFMHHPGVIALRALFRCVILGLRKPH